jgi:sugar O-acyltransferase (sialic acid O-acetyltransferase NeuD family)
MSKAHILLVGAGGHAVACIDVIEQGDQFNIAGLVGTRDDAGKHVLGYPVLGEDADLPELVARCPRALVVVGQIKTAEPRVRLFELLRGLGCELPVIISPRAYVSRHAAIGDGTIVMHGAVVNAGARIGRNCIINSQALIEHHATISDHCHVATAAIINGGVRVGAGTFVGSNATTQQGIDIGEQCVIRMGQRLVANCEPCAPTRPPKSAS